MNDEYSAQIAALEYDEKQSRQISAEEWQETASKTELISTYEKDGLKIEVSRVYPEPGDDIAYDISVSSLDNGLLQGSVYLKSIAELRLLYGALRSFMETKDEHNGVLNVFYFQPLKTLSDRYTFRFPSPVFLLL